MKKFEYPKYGANMGYKNNLSNALNLPRPPQADKAPELAPASAMATPATHGVISYRNFVSTGMPKVCVTFV